MSTIIKSGLVAQFEQELILRSIFLCTRPTRDMLFGRITAVSTEGVGHQNPISDWNQWLRASVAGTINGRQVASQ
jgi:hypothetical protein